MFISSRMIVCSLCILVLAISPVFAKQGGDQPFDQGLFSGVGIARHSYSLSEGDLNSAGWVADNPADTHVDKNLSAGYVVFAGWQIRRYVGVKVSYEDAGELAFRLGGRVNKEPFTSAACTSCAPADHFDPAWFSYKSHLLILSAEGTYPFLRRWSVSGRTGPAILFLTINDNLQSRSDHDWMWCAGIGASYAITQQLHFNLDGQIVASLLPSKREASRTGFQIGAIKNIGQIRSVLIDLEYRW